MLLRRCVFMNNITDTALLSEKCVINLSDGKNLGFACDVRFNTCDGNITAIVVPREQKLFSFCREDPIIIPWDKIECIGEDAILVRLCGNECPSHENKKGKGKKFFPWA